MGMHVYIHPVPCQLSLEVCREDGRLSLTDRYDPRSRFYREVETWDPTDDFSVAARQA